MTHRGTKNHGARPDLIKRVIIYGILVLFTAVAQCSFFSQLDICPATPDLVIGIVLAIALLDSVSSAAAVGVAAGFVTDALGSAGSVAFSAVFYLIVAVLLGALAQKMLPRFMSWLCLLIPALALRAAYTLLCICVSIRSFVPISVIGAVLVPELIVTAILCMPAYPLVKLCVIPMKAHSRFSF